MSNTKKLLVTDGPKLLVFIFAENKEFLQWENAAHIRLVRDAIYHDNPPDLLAKINAGDFVTLDCWCDQADQLAFHVSNYSYSDNFINSPTFAYLQSLFPHITCRGRKHVVLDSEMDVVSFRLMFGDRIKTVW